jgi:hypothetical protein
MTIERELLKRFMTELKTEEDVVSLFNDIKECLAEPEQTEQEPVAWMYDHQIEVGYDKYTEVNIIETCARNLESNNCINIRPLYLAPPKREPLSVERIADLWTDINTNSVRNFARAIEKEHGIGGGNE